MERLHNYGGEGGSKRSLTKAACKVCITPNIWKLFQNHLEIPTHIKQWRFNFLL